MVVVAVLLVGVVVAIEFITWRCQLEPVFFLKFVDVLLAFVRPGIRL